MKNTLFLFVAALLFSAAVNAQSTVDSIRAKYKLQPMPEALTLEKTFPAIGTYQLSAEGAGAVTITLDSVNKGIVWVEGLPVGKFKAFLKQSPATYRIMSQTSADGKAIAEGTMVFDPATNTLNVAIGKAYNDQNPAEIFALNTAAADAATTTTTTGTEVEVKTKVKEGKSKTKSKQKVVFYTATKNINTGDAVSTTSQQ